MSWMVKLSKLFPKCLTVTLFVWTYYVTLTRVSDVPQSVLFIFLTIEIVIALYTYFKVIYIGPGYPMDFPNLKVNDLSEVESGNELPPAYIAKRSVTVKRNGRFRVCRICKYWKPDRCHHCSTCDKCILKMDHHCPWFANCIGFKNQKFFIQFLIYTSLYSLTVTSFTFFQLYRWFEGKRFEEEIIDLKLLSVWLLGIAVSISVTFFTGFSIYQLCKNQTTIELYSLRRYREEIRILHGNVQPMNDYNLFDLGSASENWKDVMGTTWKEWCFPIPKVKPQTYINPLDDEGLYFKINNIRSMQLLESADLQDRLLRRVTPKSSLDVERPLMA